MTSRGGEVVSTKPSRRFLPAVLEVGHEQTGYTHFRGDLNIWFEEGFSPLTLGEQAERDYILIFSLVLASSKALRVCPGPTNPFSKDDSRALYGQARKRSLSEGGLIEESASLGIGT